MDLGGANYIDKEVMRSKGVNVDSPRMDLGGTTYILIKSMTCK